MRFLDSEKLTSLLASLAASSELWVPVLKDDSAGTMVFEQWTSGSEPVMEGFTTLSARHLLMPATEKIFSYEYQLTEDGERIDIKPAEPSGGKTIFGARACDASAITVLDALLQQPADAGYGDFQYRGRREGLMVLTLACTACDAACFCSSFENGPAEKAGSDVFLYPVDGGWLAEGITERGREILAGEHFEDSGLEPPDLAITSKVDLPGLENDLTGLFNSIEFWQEATGKCLSCGFCTYTCPTCYCFNIIDEMCTDRAGDRLRTWDACMFSLYTREASGHNPRPTAAHRYRNRVSHKFSYYPARQGKILCTGCGRCIRGCPAGLDIRDVLNGIKERQAG